MISIFSYGFFQQALLIGALSSVACGIIGCYIVLRRLSFLSASISHTVLGGVGLGLLFGVPPLLSAWGFGALATALISRITFRYKERQDVLIGIVWTIGMSVGILSLSFAPQFTADFSHYLFGNILLTTRQDLLWVSLLNIAILFIVYLFYFAFQGISFDSTYAKAMNLNVERLDNLLLQLITVSTVILLKAVGGILVIALLTLPAATAKNFTKSLSKMMGLSVTFALISTIGGTLLSYFWNLPSGPTIVILASFFYLFSLYKK